MGFAKLGNLCTIAIATSSSFSTCSSHEQRLNLLSFLAIYFVVIMIVMSLFMILFVCVCVHHLLGQLGGIAIFSWSTRNHLKGLEEQSTWSIIIIFFFFLIFFLPSFWFVCFICVCLLPPLLLLDLFMICLVYVCASTR